VENRNRNNPTQRGTTELTAPKDTIPRLFPQGRGGLKMRNKIMKDTQIFNIIKSVFPKAAFYESEDYLLENNMVQVDRKTNICWMPQDEPLTSDIYQSDSYFTLSIEMDDGFLCSIHPNLDNVIAKIKSSHK